jgi:DNA-binding IclR family transcriptional regulator
MVDRGVRFPLHTAAPGKAILAGLSVKERRAIVSQMDFERFTAKTITSARAFEKELVGVADQGYALDHGEELEGQNCIAAAIVDQYSYPVASVWITAPSNRLPEAEFERVGALVARCALEISQQLSRSIGVVA